MQRSYTDTDKCLAIFNVGNNFYIFVKAQNLLFNLKTVFRDQFYLVSVILNCLAVR